MAVMIQLLGLLTCIVVSAEAASLRHKSDEHAYSQELLVTVPVAAELAEAFDAAHYAADRVEEAAEAASKTPIMKNYSRPILAAFEDAIPGGELQGLIEGFTVARRAAIPISSFMMHGRRVKRTGAWVSTAIVVGSIVGAIAGILFGTPLATAFGGPRAVGAVAGGLVGCSVGGLAGLTWDAVNAQTDKKPTAGRKPFTHKKDMDEEEENETAVEIEEKDVPGKVVELAQPALEKLHQLALTAVAVSEYEEEEARLDGNQTEVKQEQAAEKKAIGALENITSRIDTDQREPMNNSENDFEQIQDVLSEGDASEFLSAEAAHSNNALVTANDLARVSNQNGTRLRAEDVGPNGDLKSFQGDMVPGSSEQLLLFQTLASAPQGPVTSAGQTWTKGRIPYCFASDVSEKVKHVFRAATNQYSVAVPCLDFVEVGWVLGSSHEPSEQQKCAESPAIFVQSHPNEGCYSYVGMVTTLPSQKLQLQEPGCLNIGTAIHELGHAMGMAHEQSRPDRDQHVRINWQNIQPGMENNFVMENNAYVAEEYDVLSIMHYDRFAFSKDTVNPTMDYIGSGVHDELGQRVGLSSYDVNQVSNMYQAQNAECKGNALAGTGCINKPNDSGQDICNVDKCSSSAVEHCCACGGGIDVQCYEGQDCPKTDPLPPPEGAACIQDATDLFGGQYPCIYTNVCDFNVQFKCPGFDCTHQVRSKSYEAANCNNQFQTAICIAPESCNVVRI